MQPDVVVTYADVSKAREKLGYDPHTTVAEGLARFVTWYRAVVLREPAPSIGFLFSPAGPSS